MDSQARRVASTLRPTSWLHLLVLSASLCIGGCASDGGLKGAFGKTMEAVGLKSSSQAGKGKAVPLHLLAGENLNAGAGKRGMALVLRVYQLRGTQRFEQAPFDAFLDESREKAALGEDLVSATEILVMPGQRHDIVQQVAGNATHLGVVALFRTPAASRWRFSFDAGKAVKDGITLGLHACAMTTTSAALVTTLSSEPYSLSSVNCADKR